MTRGVLALAVLLGLAPWHGPAAARDGGRPAESAETTADELRGTWAVVSVDVGGEKKKVYDEETLTFDRGKLTHKIGFRNDTNSYRIDATKSRKELDLVGPKWDDPKVVVTTKTIYRIDGDTLQIAYSLLRLGKDRPTSFGGEDVYVVILKRQK
jgi:uncharacterized protein (TIGR03067 family)